MIIQNRERNTYLPKKRKKLKTNLFGTYNEVNASPNCGIVPDSWLTDKYLKKERKKGNEKISNQILS